MQKVLLLTSLVLSSSLMAASSIPTEDLLGGYSVEETSSRTRKTFPRNYDRGGRNFERDYNRDYDRGRDYDYDYERGRNFGDNPPPTTDQRIDQASRVIQSARDLVAFGEEVYQLVQKGKPTNVTEYAPISVVPRDPESKELMEPFDLEGFSMPVEKSFVARLKNSSGKEVVTFNYKVIYSYGGSFNGKGKYLTNVIIVPSSIRTSYGWDFNATMKLSGVLNHGTKENPVAGIMITIKYQMNSWNSAYERNDTIHITGNGALKSYASN